ncbi:hypothetical protein PFICI_00956 [Pestalotiopsis fici W106-1]|uniref:SnoaL-like domain-containing protein n=1 Tax=Pestalotiopsis fici (strain W106-1 / CGMCC3.15140) TaxID=1229662 RepID=W3XM48_PESFW|nr:uncharacterized protein PFICI_00956 [Pestalotiopsis fici W106-1]ETS87128.1 hypothetical protein PFICI_00956 [Pestalotiopsis fici W106-1]
MSNLRETIENTIKTFGENNTLGVKTKDTSLFSSVLAENCIRQYRPFAFINRYPQFFKKEITNADYEAQMKVELQTMQEVVQDLTKTSIDEVQRTATIWTTQNVTTVDGTKRTVEVIWDLTFTEDGTRISQILEFVDTFESTKMLEQILAGASHA